MTGFLFAIHTFAANTLCCGREDGTVDGTVDGDGMGKESWKRNVKRNGTGTGNGTGRGDEREGKPAPSVKWMVLRTAGIIQ
jgi:hypothetical protein